MYGNIQLFLYNPLHQSTVRFKSSVEDYPNGEQLKQNKRKQRLKKLPLHQQHLLGRSELDQIKSGQGALLDEHGGVFGSWQNQGP